MQIDTDRQIEGNSRDSIQIQGTCLFCRQLPLTNRTMQPALLRVLFTALFHHLIRGNPREASEFNLDGDYLVGGLFPLHNRRKPFGEIRPVAVKCEM